MLLLALELHLVLSPTPSSAQFPLFPRLSSLVPRSWTNMPQFIWVRTLHRLFTAATVALSQLAGIWAGAQAGMGEEEARKEIHTLSDAILREGEYIYLA